MTLIVIQSKPNKTYKEGDNVSVDYYGSYTNNDLIYKAITGQTRDPTEGPNKFTPLNTPIISASVYETCAVINLVGTMLRFVSLDNGVTTPTHYNIPSNIVTQIDTYIWDIKLPDGFIVKAVGVVENAILFFSDNDEYLYFFKNGNFPSSYYYEYNDYIYIMGYDDGEYCIYYLRSENYKIETDIGDDLIISFSNNYIITDLALNPLSNKTYSSRYHSNYIFGNSSNIYVSGSFTYFNLVNGSYNSSGTTYSYSGTKSNLFNSYNISKAWLYGEAIIAQTTNSLVLVVGDNRNGRLTSDNENDFITTPYIVDWGSINNIIIDKGYNNNTGESFTILYDTLTESNNKLNLKQSTTNNNLKMSNLTQLHQTISENAIGRAITASDFQTKTAITLPGSNEVIYFKWDVTIPQNTGNEESITVTLGPYVEWDYDPDLI